MKIHILRMPSLSVRKSKRKTFNVTFDFLKKNFLTKFVFQEQKLQQNKPLYHTYCISKKSWSCLES